MRWPSHVKRLRPAVSSTSVGVLGREGLDRRSARSASRSSSRWPHCVGPVDHGQADPSGVEERGLGLEVVVHGVVVVEVFGCEVGEDAGREANGVDPMLDEGVGRDFHGDGVPTAIGASRPDDPAGRAPRAWSAAG